MRRGSAGRPHGEARRGEGQSPTRRRCRRASGSQPLRSSGSASTSTRLISRGTAGWCACSRRWSAVTRRHRPHSVRGSPGDAAHQAPRGALAQRRGPDLAMTPLVPKRPRTIASESASHTGSESASTSRATSRTSSSTNSSSSHAARRPSLERGIRALQARVATISRAMFESTLPPVELLRLRPAGAAGAEMRMRGLEPPRPYGHTDLNRARLPIPPHPRGRTILASGRLIPR